ncbi:helix-turn-helix domain-containing protein [Collimonas sp.]|uniref:helix-turn-helix domain-containing protein n=1 Tax=Collimonas sp. TaxID=1963772 RepID=UPI0037BF6D11
MADNNSEDAPPKVGDTLVRLRQADGLSLDALSKRAGVSKSMLSQIERNQANPTVAVVWRLANALGVPISLLVDGNQAAPASIETLPSHATPSLRSRDGHCVLRILGPIELAGQFEWYELSVEPGGCLDSDAHEPASREHLTVLSGTLEVQSGTNLTKIKVGETARYAADRPHYIENVGKSTATALLVVIHNGS